MLKLFNRFIIAQRRRKFATYLRNPQRWPAGFEWNYNRSTTCAIALFAKQHGIPHSDDLNDSQGRPLYNALEWEDDNALSRHFGLSTASSKVIFCRAFQRLDKPGSHVTPNDIADLLEAA